MAADAKAQAEALLESVRPDIIRAWTGALPTFGDLSINLHFVDGQVSRIDFGASIQRKVAPRAGGRA
jgi:hypothetical protein